MKTKAMRWKWLISELVLASFLCSLYARQSRPVTDELSATDSLYIEQMAQTRYEQRIAQLQRKWMKLIPSLGTFQYAGNIGIASIGLGWDYGKNDRWETSLQFGFLPKYHADKADMTFTLRENLIPWSLGLGRRRWAQPATATNTLSSEALPWNRRAFISCEPMVFSMFLNTIFDDEFWVHEPEKYNGGDYYRFSSKVRLHFGIGSRVSFNIPKEKRKRCDRASLYYELSTYDLAIISAIPNKKITLNDILCLGVGLQYKFF